LKLERGRLNPSSREVDPFSSFLGCFKDPIEASIKHTNNQKPQKERENPNIHRALRCLDRPRDPIFNISRHQEEPRSKTKGDISLTIEIISLFCGFVKNFVVILL